MGEKEEKGAESMTTYRDIFSEKERVEEMELYAGAGDVNEQLARYGVKFGIYKNNEFKEQLFPFDMIPRVIGQDEPGEGSEAEGYGP